MTRPADPTIDLTVTGSPSGAPGAPPVAAWLGQRYRLERVIGTGGTGSVVEAHDRLTGEQVAVKLMRALTPTELARVRREVTALRRVRLPGCVVLRDDGLQDGAYYVVTDLVRGTPFPGVPVPAPWRDVAPRVATLLHVLSRVHARGLVHLDLKPGNVLVGAGPLGPGIPARDGPLGPGIPARPVDVWVLDFGIASGPAVSASPDPEVRFTPRYAAPERIRGQPGDPRTDLWGVAAMALEAVTGQRPHHVAAPQDALLGAGVPAEAASVLAAMLADDPEARPSEPEVLRVLSPQAAEPLRDVALPVELVDEAALRGLFAGPDTFLHLREDGAAALFARTGGDPDAVRRELGAWVAGGLAEVHGGLVVLDRPTLDGLLAPEVHDVEAIDLLLDRGETARAAAGLEALLATARAAGDRALEAALLHRLARSAVAPAAPTYALDAVLYEIGRSGLEDRSVRATEALVRCELAVRRKQVEVAQGLLGAVFDGIDPSLEAWAWTLRTRWVLQRGPEAWQAELAALSALSRGDPERRLQWLVLGANVAYAEGRYSASAASFEEAASVAPTPAHRIHNLLGAASALLEVRDTLRVIALADDIRRWSTEIRHPGWEIRATWLARAAAYRAGLPLEVDVELVRTAALVPTEASALLALNEAALAWRRGRRTTAAALATLAEQQGRELSRVSIGMLGGALRIACGDEDADQDAVWRLVAACRLPELRAQAWALLGRGTGDPRCAERAREAARACDRRRWDWRLDVLSLAEAAGEVDLPEGDRMSGGIG